MLLLLLFLFLFLSLSGRVALACCYFLSSIHDAYKLYTRFGVVFLPCCLTSMWYSSGRILNELNCEHVSLNSPLAQCKVHHLTFFLPSLACKTIHFHIQTSHTDCRSAGLILNSNRLGSFLNGKPTNANIINFLFKFAIAIGSKKLPFCVSGRVFHIELRLFVIGRFCG